MKRDSFVFYRSFYEAIKKLNKKDKLTVYSHICQYALGEKTDEIDGVPAAIFDLIKPQIDANFRRYENGLKGGRPKTEAKPKHNQNETKAERNVNVNVNDNVNVNENVNVNAPAGSKTHTIPTFVEISLYCNQNGISTDISKFIQYNAGKGWPMDWKTALSLWTQKDTDKKKEERNKNRFNNFENSQRYDYGAIEAAARKRFLEGERA